MQKHMLCGAWLMSFFITSGYGQPFGTVPNKLLLDKLARVERLCSLRESSHRQEALVSTAREVHVMLTDMKNELLFAMTTRERSSITVECWDAFAVLERELDEIDRILQGRSALSAVFLMQLGPKLVAAVQLLNVVNTALSSKIDVLKDGVTKQDDVRWTKKMLKVSALVTTILVGIMYLGNSYEWWSVPMNTNFIDSTTFFLSTFFSA